MVDGRRHWRLVEAVLVLSVFAAPLRADWPTWRGDAARSASTTDPLPDNLKLHWQRELPPLTPAWEEDPRLHFDGGYEPIAADGLLFVASSRNDSVTAYDLDSGEQVWRHHAGGPVRFAPVAHDGVLYFGADDGCLYCVDAKTGNRLWKFLVAPNDRKVLGNARMTSVWPVRGGPVLSQGRLWFTAGVWPFEGTFLCSFDVAGAATEAIRGAAAGGTAVSIRESGLPGLMIETLDEITPQGYLVGTASRVHVPCGRSNVLIRELATEKRSVPGYRTGETSSYHVAATERFLFHGGVSVDLQTTGVVSQGAAFPVFDGPTVYFAKGGAITACNLEEPEEVVSKDRRGREVKSTKLTELWTIEDRAIHEVPGGDEHEEWIKSHPIRIDLKAGERLYGHQDQRLFALDVSAGDAAPTVAWSAELDSPPRTMLADEGRLVVVTEAGAIACFGEGDVPAQQLADANAELAENVDWSATAGAILEQSAARAGYCLVDGIGSGGLIKELARQSELQVVVVDPDAVAVDALRSELDLYGLYGTRVSAIVGDLESAQLPPYFASLATSESLGSSERPLSDARIQAIYQSLRPYGGRLLLPSGVADVGELSQIVGRTKLPSAEIRQTGELVSLERPGRLPGAADRTHESGDPSNTLMSHDELVKAPLGVLWFGGPAGSGKLFYNRHFWGPSMAVIGGRMFIQGPGNLAAVDVYTGRVLWQKPLEDTEGYRPGRAGNDFEETLSGFHFLATEDSLYLVLVDRCARIDVETGETLAEFRFADANEKWGRIRVEGGLLITEVFAEKEELGLSAVAMAALDRRSGEVRWRHDAEASFPISAISGDTVYCFDGALEGFYRDWQRKGLVPKAGEKKEVLAIDLQTGEERWRVPTEEVLTWLAFSRDGNVLIGSNKKSITAFDGTDGYVMWTKQAEGQGFRGHPEHLWDKVILWNDQILDQRGPGLAYDISTGESILRVHPITQESVDWEFTKAGHHCNYAIANPHLMTFRADTAGFCDITSGTTARLEGYRPGCRNSLIPANGVLNSPNFAHGCVCGYPLFTSLALVHRPDAELWTYSAIAMPEEKAPVKRMAINFGAPGDRQAENGSFWLGYPGRGETSPKIDVKVEGPNLHYFHDHSALVQADEESWIDASGVEGVSAVTIAVNNSEPREYGVRLIFREPHKETRPGERVFDVMLQGEPRIAGIDVVGEAGSSKAGVSKRIAGVMAGEAVRIELTPSKGQPVLCGVELISEQ